MTETAGVVITGIGVVSPLGCSIAQLTPLLQREPEFSQAPPILEITDIPLQDIPADKRSRIGRLDRLCRAFLSASYSAVTSARLEMTAENAERVGLSFGTGFGCLLTNAEYNQKIVESGPTAASPRLFAYTVSSAAAGEVSIALGIKGPNLTTHMGFAAGLGAVGYAFDLIQLDKVDVMLAGGADVIGPALLDGLRDMGLLKTPQQSRPFVDAVPGVWPSEGAVVLLLEREDHAQRRGVRTLGRIKGYAAGFEPTLTRSNRETTGAIATMCRALDLSGRAASDIDVVVGSAHGTPFDAIEREALAAVFGSGSPRVLTPKATFGEMFGASGVLGVALAAGGGCEPPVAGGREVKPLVVMVNALCYSGTIVSLILSCE